SSQAQSLSQTPAAAGNRQTWTWSGWVNASNPGSGPMDLFATSVTSSTSLQIATLRFTSSNQLQFFDDNYVFSPGVDNYSASLLTTQQFASNTWYNVVLSYDTTQAVATNRVRLYVNGTQITSFSTQIDPAQNSLGLVN